jgi:hypothetical protein
VKSRNFFRAYLTLGHVILLRTFFNQKSRFRKLKRASWTGRWKLWPEGIRRSWFQEWMINLVRVSIGAIRPIGADRVSQLSPLVENGFDEVSKASSITTQQTGRGWGRAFPASECE